MGDQTIQLYDTTLRDGMQQEGMSVSVDEKVRIALRLDELGIHFIEGGFPASNPKEADFFARMERERLRQARLVAFGMTRRKGVRAEDDENLRVLADAAPETVAIVGKTWELHLAAVLHVDRDENLRMIAESVGFLVAQGKHVVYDAEHFFDAYADDAEYALATLRAAEEAGAEVLCLCDTNGAALPPAVAGAVAATRDVLEATDRRAHPQRQRLRRRRQPGRRRRRRTPGAGHDQRLRRTLRQRQPRLHHPGPAAQDGPAGPRARPSSSASPRPPTSWPMSAT